MDQCALAREAATPATLPDRLHADMLPAKADPGRRE